MKKMVIYHFLIGKCFDHSVQGKPTHQETVPYITYVEIPNESEIQKTIQRFTGGGWLYVSRREEKDIIGNAETTILTFQQ
jgi:hypothetical protein